MACKWDFTSSQTQAPPTSVVAMQPRKSFVYPICEVLWRSVSDPSSARAPILYQWYVKRMYCDRLDSLWRERIWTIFLSLNILSYVRVGKVTVCTHGSWRSLIVTNHEYIVLLYEWQSGYALSIFSWKTRPIARLVQSLISLLPLAFHQNPRSTCLRTSKTRRCARSQENLSHPTIPSYLTVRKATTQWSVLAKSFYGHSAQFYLNCSLVQKSGPIYSRQSRGLKQLEVLATVKSISIDCLYRKWT